MGCPAGPGDGEAIALVRQKLVPVVDQTRLQVRLSRERVRAIIAAGQGARLKKDGSAVERHGRVAWGRQGTKGTGYLVSVRWKRRGGERKKRARPQPVHGP